MQLVWQKCFYLFCKYFFKFYCPLKITGKENIPSSSFILCSNHCSHMDTPVLMLATGLSFNKFGMVAAKDYFFSSTKRKSLASRFMNLIPVNRRCTRESLLDYFSACNEFIHAKKGNLIIYPEGTRSLSGEINRFKRGSVKVAAHLGIPIVPVYIDGTYKALKKGRLLPRASTIRVTIGKPIYLQSDQSKHAGFTKEMTKMLENSIRQMKYSYEKPYHDT